MSQIAQLFPVQKVTNYGRRIGHLKPMFSGNRFVRWMKSKAWKWISRDAFEDSIERIESNRVCVDASDILTQLRISRSQIRQIFNGEAKYLLCGRDVQYKLFGELSQKLGFWHLADDIALACDGESRVMGMRIVFVPWIEGWALLPEMPDATKLKSHHTMERVR